MQAQGYVLDHEGFPARHSCVLKEKPLKSTGLCLFSQLVQQQQQQQQHWAALGDSDMSSMQQHSNDCMQGCPWLVK
jgi:hypothetical protein